MFRSLMNRRVVPRIVRFLRKKFIERYFVRFDITTLDSTSMPVTSPKRLRSSDR